MAREKVDDTAHTEDSADSGDAGDSGSTAGAAPPGPRDSGTAASAARARTVMQRRHLRIGLVMSAAVGVEIAGAAGLAAAGLLPWQWQERLWGRTDPAGLTVQIGVGLVVLALAVAWWRREDPRFGARCRAAELVPAAVVGVLAVALHLQADLGSRGAGPLLAAGAAVLVLAGAVAWLVGLRQLRVLFPFGLADARSRGFGNLAVVRRAQSIGGPAGAVGGAALVAGAALLVPGWVSTVDTQTSGPLALTGGPAVPTGEPSWTVEVAAAPESVASTVWATPGGLVVEEARGVQVLDPRSGEARWHWRDEAYRRTGAVVTDGGRTVVLALQYQGEPAGRDRVVALDTATGELRWDRYDGDLVTAMATASWAPPDGDWFVVPEQSAPAADGAGGEVTLRGVSSDGQTRWRIPEADGCSYVAAGADTSEVLVTTQQCTGDGAGQESDPGGAGGQQPPGDASCQVAGLDPASGEPRWSWPEAGEAALDCQVHPMSGLVLVSYQQDAGRTAVGLDPVNGAPLWTLAPDDESADADGDPLAGLNNNPVRVADSVLGVELAGGEEDLNQLELVVRDATDGQLRQRVGLPDGQPVQVASAGDDHAAVTLYRPESEELVVVDVDPASATVESEVVLPGTPEGAALRQVTMASGPLALTVDTLYATGPEPGPDDYRLRVSGW